jgi:hypothetical protein
MKLVLDCKDCGTNLDKCKCTDAVFDFTDIKTADAHIAHSKRLKEDPQYKEAWQRHREEEIKSWWNELKPFVTEADVPNLPNPLTEFYIQRLIQLGAIPLDDLVDGQWYYGNYRNSTLCRWDADKKLFHLLRYKFGYRWDTCNHFQHDDGYALFVPLRIATVNEVESEMSLAPANI